MQHTLIVLPINDPSDVACLLSKHTPGPGNKGGGWNKNIFWEVEKKKRSFYWEDFFYEEGYCNAEYEFVMLPKNRVALAKELIPAQNTSWSCGPNSAGRVIVLLGDYTSEDSAIIEEKYPRFRDSSPRYIHRQKLKKRCEKRVKVGFWMMFGSALFAPVTGGVSLLGVAGGVIETGRGITDGAISDISTDVGPTPPMLSGFLSHKLNKGRAKHYSTVYFSDMAKAIKIDINSGDPTIILLVKNQLSMHYMTVVGYAKKKKTGKTTHFVLLDTDKTIGYIDYNHLQHWMNTLSLPFFVTRNKYYEAVRVYGAH